MDLRLKFMTEINCKKSKNCKKANAHSFWQHSYVLPKKNEWCSFRQRTYLHFGSSSFSNCSVFWRICILISFSMENIVMCYRFCEPISTLNSFPVASQMLVINFCHVTCLALVSDSHALEKKLFP